MIDCFNNTSNVVYGNLPTELHKDMILPTGLKLRGYIFAGWYDNPNFEGKPIVKIEDTSKKVILYAKFISSSSFEIGTNPAFSNNLSEAILFSSTATSIALYSSPKTLLFISLNIFVPYPNL